MNDGRTQVNSSVFVLIPLFVLTIGSFGFTANSEDEKVVVLTFDDAVKSHRTFVAPLLKELGFGATFFCHPQMDG